MKTLFCLTILPALILSVVLPVWAQQTDKKADAGTISGHISIDGKPMVGVAVVLLQGYIPTPDQVAVARALTDSEGRFQLTNIAAGMYRVKPLTPDFFVPLEKERFYDTGKIVTLGVGETVDSIDFALKRGAVITGRIIDGNKQPLIEEPIQVTWSNKDLLPSLSAMELEFSNPLMAMTDDRGIYRIYGLPPGQYQISVGRGNWDRVSGSSVKMMYQETFYPGVTDRKKAENIEVKEGEEVKNIDITIGAKLKTYKATGRIIDAETGNPVAGMVCSYGPDRFSTVMGSIGTSKKASDEKGEFQIEGMLPGSYSVVVQNQQDFYSKSDDFTVKDSDVSGLEVKLYRGASISGKVIIENADEKKNVSTILPITLYVQKSGNTLQMDDVVATEVKEDGSFHLSGVPPGNVKISYSGQNFQSSVWLLYIEREGKSLLEGVNVRAGEHIQDVRVVVAQGAGIIRGQVNIKEEDRQRISQVMIYALPKTKYGTGPLTTFSNLTSIDEKSRFFLSSVPLGEYEVTLNIKLYRAPRYLQQQTVTVTKGKDEDVIFTVELKPEEKDKDN